jgi:epoxyqueuosine reductase
MDMKESIRALALAAGFVRVRFLAPFVPPGEGVPANYREGAPALLTAALVYGNVFPEAPPARAGERRAWIAPFARRNYYREAVKRLRGLSRELRARFGGEKAGFRILCNSPVPEKPLATASGLGVPGRNGLILCAEAGSLFVIAAMTLPYGVPGDRGGPAGAEAAAGGCPEGPFPLCGGCDPARPPCAAACPTGALGGDGKVLAGRCIQWYASGHGGKIPAEVRRHWGERLYGCTDCQDACALNRRPLKGIETGEGPLPPFFNAAELLALDDGALRARFRGTALGLSWLSPAVLRRSAALAAGRRGDATAR